VHVVKDIFHIPELLPYLVWLCCFINHRDSYSFISVLFVLTAVKTLILTCR